jgi:HNH endonuclease/Protein of unknown function DUF262
MKIELREVTIRELAEGYEDSAGKGVVALSGQLDVRPPYQREFIYKDKQRDAVIATVVRNFPLNVMYWASRADGGYEVIDGQQRTISVCQYVAGDYSVQRDGRMLAFSNLQDDQQRQLLDYKLMVYVCTGDESEKLEWFRTINIAGERLTEQELRNAVFAGPWLSDARRYFSKPSCPAYQIGQDYLSGSPIRQEYLQTALDWISTGAIDMYMSAHQHDQNAAPLWRYFQSVIEWVKTTFTVPRKKFMKSVEWGHLYNQYKDKAFDTAELERETARLIADDDVERKAGIYTYLLTGDERHLSIRAFTDSQKQKAYERQGGICPVCKTKFELHQMEGDHITPWHAGGKTGDANLQMLCKDDNRRKSGR